MGTVFLGGTCNESTWRSYLKSLLTVDYFDPVVPDWTEAAQQRELHERATAAAVLYTITPRMTGVYSIAEVVDDSNKRPASTVLCLLRTDGDLVFDDRQWRSLGAVAALVERNGGRVVSSLDEAAQVLNTMHSLAPAGSASETARGVVG